MAVDFKPTDQSSYDAGVTITRKEIRDALRRIAQRYSEQGPGRSEQELTIRRAIEEVFEAPLPWVDIIEPPVKNRR